MSAHRNRDRRHVDQAIDLIDRVDDATLRRGINRLIVAAGGLGVPPSHFRPRALRDALAAALNAAAVVDQTTPREDN